MFQCVLASVIVVALKGMLMQTMDFISFWKINKLDAIVWMGTFLAVVFIGIDIGLLVGVLLSLATIIIMAFKPYTCLLGSVPQTDLYLDTNRYKAVSIFLRKNHFPIIFLGCRNSWNKNFSLPRQY